MYFGRYTKDLGKKIFSGLKSLEYRGYDSWGIYVFADNKKSRLYKTVGKLPDKVPSSLEHFDGSVALGHTRWATHGGVTKANAHPHIACDDKVVVVHNGIVENWSLLKRELEFRKHRFRSETDTEVIAHFFEEISERLNIESAYKAFETLKGFNTVIVFFPKQKELYAFRRGSPLVIGKEKQGFLLSSDIPGLLQFTNQIYALEDNQMLHLYFKAGVPKADLYINTEGKLQKINLPFEQIKMQLSKARLGSHKHFMYKEILEQPEVLQRLANLDSSLYLQLYREIFTDTDQEKADSTLFFTGAGTAGHAGLAAQLMFTKLGKRSLFILSSEFEHYKKILSKKDVLIALSQSGETIDTLSAIKIAKEKGVHCIGLINVPASTMTRQVDYTFYLQAGVEKAVVSTKAFLSKLAVLYVLGGLYSNKNKTPEEIAVKVFQGSLSQIGEQMRKWITEHERTIKKLAKTLRDRKHIFILGTGASVAIAKEGALKIKEASYIHAEAFEKGELKHGVIALIEKGTPVISINDHFYQSAHQSTETKARGAFTIGIGTNPDETYDLFIEVPSAKGLPLDWFAQLFYTTLVFQLLAYYLAIQRGINPDTPRNLAKSVTVI